MIEKLRLFLVIIEEGSLRRAAERLHISQSAITRQIQLLEHDLGGPILERASSGVRPTIGGQALARKSRGLLADYDSVMAEARRMVERFAELQVVGFIDMVLIPESGFSDSFAIRTMTKPVFRRRVQRLFFRSC